jgi:hypothetical protein
LLSPALPTGYLPDVRSALEFTVLLRMELFTGWLGTAFS